MAIEWTNRDDPTGLPMIDDQTILGILGSYRPVIATNPILTEFAAVDVPYGMYRNISYPWDEELVRTPGTFVKNTCRWMDFRCGYYGLFKPSVYEVVSQIDQAFVDDGRYARTQNSWWIDPDTVVIYRSGSWQRALVHFGLFTATG